MPSMRHVMAVALAAGLLMAGCGDDDEEEPASTQGEAPAQTESSETTGRGASTRVVLSDFAIDPANPKVEAGPHSFAVVNEGSAPHRLEIEGGGVEEVTETLEGTGDEVTLEVDLPAGEYEWYCPIGNHAEQGMEGTLTVE
jgi:plastocyanin